MPRWLGSRLPIPQALSGEQRMQALGHIEVLRRALDHAGCRLIDALDTSGGFEIDGHRNAKSAVKHRCRVTGSEALRRVRTARAWRHLPAVAAACEQRQIPVESMRAIGTAVANPRVAEFLDAADPVFAEQAATETVDDFVEWLHQWERLADADGAAEATDKAHKRRSVTLTQNDIDGSWHLRGTFGPLHGAVLNRILTKYEDAEFQADWDEAKQRLGTQPRLEQLERSSGQRRADALLAVVPPRRVHTGRRPLPRAAGQHRDDPGGLRGRARPPRRRAATRRPADVDAHRCHTDLGERIPASEALQAALLGYVRRVVVDSHSNVIDLGRRRRLFTGSSREAVELQNMLRGRTGIQCSWPGDRGHPFRQQADHREPAARGGPTDAANGDLYCGAHNRLKERGFRPVRTARRRLGHPAPRRPPHHRLGLSTRCLRWRYHRPRPRLGPRTARNLSHRSPGMPMTEPERHELYELAKHHVNDRFAELMISALPPDPSRLATKDDLAILSSELRVEMRDLTSQQTRTLMVGLVLSITALAITQIVLATIA
jgi:hypothetical protein